MVKNIYIFIPHSFLVINVYNQGNLCSLVYTYFTINFTFLITLLKYDLFFTLYGLCSVDCFHLELTFEIIILLKNGAVRWTEIGTLIVCTEHRW